MILVSLVVVAGCGQRIVDGQFLGDAAIRLSGQVHDVGQPSNPYVGALWLGYDLASPLTGLDTAVLPIASTQVGRVDFEILGAPPSAGQYLDGAGAIVPATMRIGRLIIFDDGDHDRTFTLDAAGNLTPPDCLLAMANAQALLYVAVPPSDPGALDAAHLFLGNWEVADVGYHLISLDGPATMPLATAQVIDSRWPVGFVSSSRCH
jgi:hypothetical protein